VVERHHVFSCVMPFVLDRCGYFPARIFGPLIGAPNSGANRQTLNKPANNGTAPMTATMMPVAPPRPNRPQAIRAMPARMRVIRPAGEAKQYHCLTRFRLRRLPKVNIEGLMVAAGQNLKRLIKHRRERLFRCECAPLRLADPAGRGFICSTQAAPRRPASPAWSAAGTHRSRA